MKPKRIASLLASATEILYGIGLGDRVVAVSHECDYPADVAAKPRVTTTLVAADAPSGEIDRQVREMSAAGSALYGIDVERLAELAPDLIVTQAQCDVCAVRYADVLEAVGSVPTLEGTQVVAINPTNLREIFEDIRRVGQATGYEAEAARFVAQLEARVGVVRQKSATMSAADRPRVACIEWIDPPMLAANWMPELVELAGGAYPLSQTGEHSTYADWQSMVRYDPEVVVVMPCGFDLQRTSSEASTLERLADWQTMSAVKNGRVILVDGNAYFNRSGPRIVDSLEILAHLLHPDQFGPPESVADPERVWSCYDARSPDP